MPARIRLARQGRKKRPYYHIVVADSRAPRDGRFIERVGSYDPTTNPATIVLDFDKALSWLQNGAQPSDTVRAILRYEGVLLKKHLLDGIKKGALDEATAESRFEAWKRDKLAKIQAKRDRLSKADDDVLKKRLQVESKISQDRADAIAKKQSALADKLKSAKEEAEEEAEIINEQQETTVEDTVPEETTAEPETGDQKEEVAADTGSGESAPGPSAEPVEVVGQDASADEDNTSPSAEEPPAEDAKEETA